MAVEQNITADNRWFIGENKILEFEPLLDDGKLITDATKGVEDMTGKALVWSLKKEDKSGDPAIIEKRTSGTGPLAVINIVGIYNAVRATNTQRIQIVIDSTDTDLLKAGTYRHSMKQLVTGAKAILMYGSAVLLKATAPIA